MNYIEELAKMDVVNWIITGVLILIVVKFCIELGDYLLNRLGITTKKTLKKQEIETRVLKLEEHDREQYTTLCDIKTMLVNAEEYRKKTNIATCRSTLYRLHKEFMNQGYITDEGLKTFIEIGKIYEESGGNDIYHSKLYPDIMSLKIK